jgi:hypothetical protein
LEGRLVRLELIPDDARRPDSPFYLSVLPN